MCPEIKIADSDVPEEYSMSPPIFIDFISSPGAKIMH
jgi:hypothetical protein